MANLRTGKHISRSFNDELDKIRNNLLAMGGLVEQQISKATRAFQERDSNLAEEVLQEGAQVNHLEKKIDEESAQCLAKRQPAASDLRLILTVVKIVSDVERIGDQAERLARIANKLSVQQRPRNNYQEIFLLAEQVRQMFYDALDAFARMDVEMALKVIRIDDKVNQEYDAIVTQYTQIMKDDPASIDRSLDIMWAARAMERIGDHSCNICEYIIYLARGKDVRHKTIEEQAQRVFENR